MTIRQGVRLRFRKEGDLRWISHRDLAQAVERLFRRAGLKLSFSEGFHPKPRIRLALALAVGIRGMGEVLDVDLAEERTATELLSLLQRHTAPGLEFFSALLLDPHAKKAQPTRAIYEIPTPLARSEAIDAAIVRLLAQTTLTVTREDKPVSFELAPSLSGIEFAESRLRFGLRVTGTAGLRPREILAALDLGDLEYEGAILTRVWVELEDEPSTLLPLCAERDTLHEKGNVD